MVNLASLHAAINVLRGKRIERWEPTRSADYGPAAGGGEDAA
jgi:hypothetical protein